MFTFVVALWVHIRVSDKQASHFYLYSANAAIATYQHVHASIARYIFSPCTVRWHDILFGCKRWPQHRSWMNEIDHLTNKSLICSNCYCGSSYMKKTCFLPLMKSWKQNRHGKRVKAQLTLPISNFFSTCHAHSRLYVRIPFDTDTWSRLSLSLTPSKQHYYNRTSTKIWATYQSLWAYLMQNRGVD